MDQQGAKNFSRLQILCKQYNGGDLFNYGLAELRQSIPSPMQWLN